MKLPTPRWLVAPLLVCVLAVTAAACGEDEASETGAATTGAATTAGPAIKVGIVTDIGGLNDRSFNSLAYAGLKRAESELGAEIRALTSKSNADYVPNLSTLAQQDYDLVVGVGFLMADAIDAAAKKFPETNFAIIDFSQAALKSKPGNVQGLLFKEQEAGYLAGYLAGLVAKEQSITTISSVGGQKIPPVDHYIAGFKAGAEASNPDVEVLNAYSQDFVDQAKCKELALNQIAEGSGIVFQVAGQCGLGALDAAKEKGKLGIGVDADQAFLGDHILTSALKKVDQAVFDTVKEVQDGSFAGGDDVIFDVKSQGVGLGKIGTAGETFGEQLSSIESDIAGGTIADIPDTVE